MMLEITIASDAPHFSQENQIFGHHYLLEFEWIEREGYWILHLYDAAEKAIALGLKMSASWPIFIDPATNIALALIVKTSQTALTQSSLHRDFSMVAYEFV